MSINYDVTKVGQFSSIPNKCALFFLNAFHAQHSNKIRN